MVRTWSLVIALFCASMPGLAWPEQRRGDEAGIEVEADDATLRIEFPESMRAIDNAPIREVTIRPHRPLSCNWDDDLTIDCTVDSEELLPPATRMLIDIAPGLFTAEGRPIGTMRLTAETERPELSANITAWASGVPKMLLAANMPMATDDAAHALELRSGGRVWRDLRLTEVATTYDAWERQAPRFSLALPHDLPADTVVELWRREGMASTAGPLRAEAPKLIAKFRHAEPFRLRGLSCAQPKGRRQDWGVGQKTTIDCVAGEPLHVYFSAPLSEEAQKAFASRLPPGVRVLRWHDAYERPDPDSIRSAHSRAVELSASQALTTFEIDIDADVRDTFGRSLQNQTRATIRNGLPMPSLRASSSRMLLGDANGAKAVAANAPAVPVIAQAFGTAAVSERFETPKSRESIAVFSSAATRRALTEGGWVRWRPQTGGVLQMAAPQFDLSAQVGTRGVVAWAIGWDDHRPIANAVVELSLIDEAQGERVLARGTTGRDGLALLTLPEDFVAPDEPRKPEWILRAVSGVRRAVLALGGLYDYGLKLGVGVDQQRVFAIADRPLYRAGDTVRYRGWARTLRGGRMRHPNGDAIEGGTEAAIEGAIELALVSAYEERTFHAWKIVADAEGGFVGEYVLPAHLVDGDYCIRAKRDDHLEYNGVCFFVGTFRAQDLWVETEAQTPLLRPGDMFNATVSAGYWSGGGASGVGLQRVATMLYPESPAQAYPQYAEYRFADHDGDESYFLDRGFAQFPALDADGRARIAIPIAFDEAQRQKGAPPPFGRIEMTVEAGLAGRESVASPAAVARYAQFDRYVGLRVLPAWFDARTPLRMDGVVIDAAGRAQSGAAIEVHVEYLAASDDAQPPLPTDVARCALKPGTPAACDVPRKRSGRYRFTARSGDAAPAVFERYVWNAADAGETVSAPAPALTLIAAPATANAPMRALLRQPYPQADALVVVSAGGEVLDARVFAIDRTETELTLATHADGRNRVRVDVLVRARAASLVHADGLRAPPRIAELDLMVDVPRRDGPAAIEIAFDAARTMPGDTRTLRLRNRSDRPRTVTLAVLDDALRSLAGARWSAFDPRGEAWLGRRESGWEYALKRVGFSDWNAMPWKTNLPWEDAPQGSDDVEARGSRVPRASESEASSPVLVLDREGARAASLVSAGELDQVGDVLFNISASDGGALRTTLGFSGAQAGDEDGELDRVTVTGSRIRRASALGVGDATSVGKLEPGLVRGERERRVAEARALFGARLRQRFEDTALWLPALRLAAGETREIAFTAPDNLTRWRAVAWSAGLGEDFEMIETVLEAGLPVEARLQTPVRLYPGDRADLVANLRHDGETPVRADATVQVEALNAEITETVALAARGQSTLSLAIAPNAADAPTGAGASRTLAAVAAVRIGAHSDALTQAIELASPNIAARKVQAGWLGASSHELGSPELPASARDLRVSVSLLPGADALMHDWIDDLHRYPHRCWEQILSRAVAAAIALERGEGDRFPGAKQAIGEALENVAVFQGERGGFRYFADTADSAYDDPIANAPLTAYSVRALRLLATLGHAVPPEALRDAEDYLLRRSNDSYKDTLALQRVAFVAAGQAQPKRALTDRLWAAFDDHPLPVRVATARAMANGRHPEAKRSIDKLLAATKRRGEARVLRAFARHDRWMSSDLREQCELIGVLRDHPALAETAMRRALIAGLGDLYSGGYADVDTQTGASCLIALRGLEAATGDKPVRLSIERGGQRATLALAPGAGAQVWERALDPSDAARPLRLRPEIDGDAPASYLVEYRYDEDARRAESAAIGFALERRYAVLRDARWTPLESENPRDGDWVRISLILRNGSERHFVAITDQTPGGLRPTDLALSGVAGLDLQQVSDTGSAWFRTRRLDPRAPKFYAEYLPPGAHEVHYFARVGNSGDYLAAPAVAELMYGSATRARTAATRVVIVPASESAAR